MFQEEIHHTSTPNMVDYSDESTHDNATHDNATHDNATRQCYT